MKTTARRITDHACRRNDTGEIGRTQASPTADDMSPMNPWASTPETVAADGARAPAWGLARTPSPAFLLATILLASCSECGTSRNGDADPASERTPIPSAPESDESVAVEPSLSLPPPSPSSGLFYAEPTDSSGELIYDLDWVDANTLVTVTREGRLSRWQREPLEELERTEPGTAEMSVEVNSGRVLSGCGETHACIFRASNLELIHRLECPGERLCRRPTFSSDGRWAVAVCSAAEEPDPEAMTCIWDTEQGLRIRCQPTGDGPDPFHAFTPQPSGDRLLVSVADGFMELRPPAFEPGHTLISGCARRRTQWLDQAQRVFLWDRCTQQVFDTRDHHRVSETDVLNPIVSAAPSPQAPEMAVLYRTALVIHDADGHPLRHLLLDVSDGNVAWSDEGTFIAVELTSDEGTSVRVFQGRDLSPVWQLQRPTFSPRNPIRWAPGSSRLAVLDETYRSLRIEEAGDAR